MILISADYQKYVPQQTSSFDFKKYEAFEMRAFYKHLPRYLGDDLADQVLAVILENSPDASGSGGPMQANEPLAENVKPVLANLVVLESIPFLDVVLTSTGFGIVNNGNIAPASRERVQAFADACLMAANDFLHILLGYLEKKVLVYTIWNKCSLNTGRLIANTAVFNSASLLNITRQQFVDVRSFMLETENTMIEPAISAEFFAELCAGTDNVVKPLLQRALAFLAYNDYLNNFTTEKQDTVWKLKGLTMLARAKSVLIAKRASYSTFETYGYSAPYDNDADDNQDSPFFVAGGTA
jgi:hypothetical protein